jgi:phenylacetate-coenzyme A ligase PaaK-like adenylate-forming protein
MYLTTEDLQGLAGSLHGISSSEPAVLPSIGSIEMDAWRTSRAAWFTVLLRQTLEFAESTVPFYRTRVAEGGPRAQDLRYLSDLTRFPILSRAQIARAPKDFLSEAVPVETMRHTSATMGQRLTIYGNRAEAEADAALRRVGGLGADARSEGLLLRVIPAPRRLQSALAAPGVIPMLTLGYNPNEIQGMWSDHTDNLAEVLADTYLLGGTERRITSLHMTPPWIFAVLTDKLVTRGIDPSGFAVRHVVLSGGTPTAAIRQRVREHWNATCHSSYSCTEVEGDAPESATDPGIFLPGAKCYLEIVDPDTFAPIAPGEVGVIVLTSLSPFQQAMPLIRYNTRDLAQRVTLDEGSAQTRVVEAFRPIGRHAHCLQVGPRQFIGTTDVLNAVSRFREVPQIPYPRYNLALLDQAGDRRVVMLNLEAVWMPESARERLEDQVAAEIAAVFARRAGPHPELSFRCSIVKKGGLSAFFSIYLSGAG